MTPQESDSVFRSEKYLKMRLAFFMHIALIGNLALIICFDWKSGPYNLQAGLRKSSAHT